MPTSEITVNERESPRPAPNRRRPRILVLGTTLPAKPGDGTPEFVLTLARSLADAFEITILAPRVPGSAKRETIDGVEIRRFPYFPQRWEGVSDGAIVANLKAQPWRWLEVPSLMSAFGWQALRLAGKIRPALIHAHWIVPAGLIALGLKKRMRIPYVLTIHGADAYTLQGAAMRHLKRRIVRGAGVATPVSRDIARRFSLPESHVAPMGVDMEAIRRAVGPRKPISDRFLFVGRLAEKKGLDVLIRALSMIPGARLVAAGDGPEGPALSSLATELRVDDRVEFLGSLPRDRIMEELRIAQALVIPSKVARSGDQEGTPVVLAEGMAAGVPIIASALGGLAEHVTHGDTGILTEPGSVSSLADALREASDGERLRSIAERAVRHAREHLDIDGTRHRYEMFFGAVLGRHGL